MQAQCSNCGRLSEAALCAECQTDRRTRNIVIGVIFVTVIGVLIIGIFGYLALSTPSTSSQYNAPKKITPGGATTPNSTLPVNPGSTGSATTAPGKISSTAEIAALTDYSEALQPRITDARNEMNGVIVDIKQFLKTANATNNPRDTKKVLDEFRETLKKHEQRWQNLSDGLKSISPPTSLKQQHERLNEGVRKYLLAVKSYIQGLADYSFNQIRLSQTDLETADHEIRAATDDFQQAINNLLKAS